MEVESMLTYHTCGLTKYQYFRYNGRQDGATHPSDGLPLDKIAVRDTTHPYWHKTEVGKLLTC